MSKKLIISVLTGIAVAGGGVIATHRLATTWGSRPEERVKSLPGDYLVDECQTQADRAITIDAPADAVWPWLVQIGQDRAGFYSYEALENAIGCEIVGVGELRPEWAARNVGDLVRLAPEVAVEVAVVDPPNALVLAAGEVANGWERVFGSEEPGGAFPKHGQGGDTPGMPQAFSWAFVVSDEGDGTSRLHIRERYRFGKKDRLMGFAVPFVSAVMTQKMLRTIRALAEAA